MWPLEWIANSPEGARLGELAVQSLRVETTPLPWWAFPWEPLRWFFVISGIAPHSFYTAAAYLMATVVTSLWVWRKRDWRCSLGCGLTMMMTLLGGYQANTYICTQFPSGERWIVPEGAAYRLANLHAHSQASGGSLMPEDVVRWHQAHGYSVVAITDSNKVYGGIRAQAKMAGSEMVVLCGEEYRGRTHLLMLNLESAISADEVPMEKAIAQARAQGALVVVAHPWTSPLTPGQLLAMGAQGFEVASDYTVSPPAVLQLGQRADVCELGDLDFRSGDLSHTATVLPRDADTPKKVQQALVDRRCAALFTPHFCERRLFGFWSRLRIAVPVLWNSGGRLLLPGLALAWGVLRGFQRLPAWKGSGWALLACIVLLCGVSGVLGAWSVWWKFKVEWFPRIELAVGFWALAAPLCCYCSRELFRKS